MIEMVSKRLVSGDVSVTLARRYLRNSEWGMARKVLEEAISKGNISDLQAARGLMSDINQRLGVRSCNTQT